MTNKLPTLPFMWGSVVGILLFGLIFVISAAALTTPKMAAFTLTSYNSCLTPTSSPTPLPPGWPSPTPQPTSTLSTPYIAEYVVATPFVELRFPPNDASLSGLRTVHLAAQPAGGIVEVVFKKDWQRYAIQRCNERICPLSEPLAAGFYEWYVRVCETDVCWRVSEIWRFSIQPDD